MKQRKHSEDDVEPGDDEEELEIAEEKNVENELRRRHSCYGCQVGL